MRALPIAFTLALAVTVSTSAASGRDARRGETPAADVHGGYGAGGESPELTRLLEGRVAGAPRSCLSLLEMRDSRVFHGTIIYRVSRDKIYRNDLNGCPELNSNSFPIFKSTTGQICQGDIVDLVDRGVQFPIGACSVGPFVPYTRAR